MKQLKFNPDKDMKELEKYGYEYESVLEVYYKMIIPHKWSIFLFDAMPKAKVITIQKYGKVVTKKMAYWLDWNECNTNPKDVKDLIKANLLIVENKDDKNN